MPLWVPVAFLAVLLWVIGNIADKFLVEKYFRDKNEDTDTDTLFLFSSVFAVPTLLLALFMGSGVTYAGIPALAGVLSGICNGAYIFAYLRAISRTELSRIIPIAQTVPLFGFVFAWFLLGEHLRIEQLFAGMLTVTGAMVLVFHRDKGRFDIPSLILILIASASIALQMVLFKISATDIGYWSGVFWSNVGLIIFGLVIYAVSRHSRVNFHNLFRHKSYKVMTANAVNEVIEVAAILVFAAATLLGPVALVQTVTAYQPIILLFVTFVAAKLGLHYLKEDTTHTAALQKLLGIALVGAGSVLIYLPALLT